jgi:hypothetical protein
MNRVQGFPSNNSISIVVYYFIYFLFLFISFLDSANLLAMGSFCHINAELQGNAVLPCRPTSPDIKITLSKDEKSVSIK